MSFISPAQTIAVCFRVVCFLIFCLSLPVIVVSVIIIVVRIVTDDVSHAFVICCLYYVCLIWYLPDISAALFSDCRNM